MRVRIFPKLPWNSPPDPFVFLLFALAFSSKSTS
jgi:hypothetical protein